MTNPLSDERLAEIRERFEKATPGPWSRYANLGYGVISEADFGDADSPNVTHGSDRASDAEFIAHAREDVPALLAEVERLRAELADLQGQTALTESHFSNFAADTIVEKDQLRRRAENAEAELERLLAERSSAGSRS